MKKLSVCKNNFLKKYKKGFTIVELLVVIVVIGILAAITIVSYTGITSKAVASTLQADLSGASNKLKIWQLNNDSGDYPETISCTIPDSATNMCVKPSGASTYSYTVDNTARPRTFSLTETSDNGAVSYKITHDSAPVAVTSTSPILASPLADTIATSGATLRASITSDGGAEITDSGFCWGPSLNPTGNCSSAEVGSLTALSPATMVSPDCSQTVTSPDSKSLYIMDGCNNIIYMYSRDVATGALTALSPATITLSGTCFGLPAISPDGTSLYMTGRAPGCGPGALIFMYTRNTDTGVLAPASPNTIAASDCLNIVLSPDGKSLYGSDGCNNTISMYDRNASSGVLTALSPATIAVPGSCFSTPKISADSKSFYLTGRGPGCGMDNHLFMYNRDTTTGALSAVGSGSMPTGDCTSVSIPNDNKSLYIFDSCNGIISMYSRNATTGELTALSPATISIAGTCFSNMIVSSDNKSVYVPGRDAGCMNPSLFMYSRDTTTGNLTALSPSSIPTGNCLSMLSSSDAKSVYAVDNCNGIISMYNRNITTGNLTALNTPAITVPGTCFNNAIMSADGGSIYMPGRDPSCGMNNMVFMYGRNTNVNGSTISKVVTGMPSGTLIHYRGYSTNSVGTGYTADATFTTN